MPSFSFKLRLALVVMLLAVASNWLAAQGRQSGEIRGTVMDQSQAVVQGVKVTITNIATGVSKTVMTDESGLYDAPYLQAGEYTVTFAKVAFKTLTRSGITLRVETITVNGSLEIGATSEKVTVLGDAPLVQTESVEKNTTFTASMVSAAPSIDRNWMDLFAAVPGVNPGSEEQSTGQGVGVNGQQPFFSNWQIDGGIAMLGQSSNPDELAPPIETIQEVSLSTANFGAEHGNGLSVFNVITKSGTNKFHGSVYEYIENDAANAENKFAQPPPFNKPILRWNEYGFNLGGPIKKNKAFFFFSFERNPIHSVAPTYESYPTTGLQPNGGQGYVQGDFSMLLGTPTGTTNPCDPSQVVLNGQIYDPLTTQKVTWKGHPVICRLPFPGNIIPQSRFDPVAAKIQQNFLAPNLSEAGNVNNFYSLEPSDSLERWINGKLDYDINPKNRLTGSLMVVNFDNPYTDPICDINCSHWGGNEVQGQITDVLDTDSQRSERIPLLAQSRTWSRHRRKPGTKLACAARTGESGGKSFSQHLD